MTSLEHRTTFQPYDLEETGGQSITSLNAGAQTLKNKSFGPSSAIAETPSGGTKITFIIQSTLFEQLLMNKMYLACEIVAGKAAGEIVNGDGTTDGSLDYFPLAQMFSSSQIRINSQLVSSIDNLGEVAIFNYRTLPKSQRDTLASTMHTDAIYATQNDAVRGAYTAGFGVKGQEFLLPLGLVHGMCSSESVFAIPAATIELSFTVHSDYVKRIIASIIAGRPISPY